MRHDADFVPALWDRIERWFADHRPKLDLQLRPGAGEDAIAAAEQELGVPFPEDFRASLRVHDGQDDACEVTWLPFAQRLGSIASLVACWRDDRRDYDEALGKERLDWLDDERRVRQVHLHPGHIPFAGSAYWDYDRLLLDFVPGPEGSDGQIIARNDIHLRFVAPNFAALLARLAAGLENGTIRIPS